jgi:hypothetical protein
MKKKLWVVLAIFALSVGLSACSSKSETTDSSNKKAESVKEKSTNRKDRKEKRSSASKSKRSDTPPSSSSTSASSTDSDMFDLMIEAAQSQIESQKKQFGDLYSDITITKGEGHTIVYAYTFNINPVGDIDGAALKPTLVKGMKPIINSTKGLFPDVKIQVIYLRADKSELANITITQEDTDSVS